MSGSPFAIFWIVYNMCRVANRWRAVLLLRVGWKGGPPGPTSWAEWPTRRGPRPLPTQPRPYPSLLSAILFSTQFSWCIAVPWSHKPSWASLLPFIIEYLAPFFLVNPFCRHIIDQLGSELSHRVMLFNWMQGKNGFVICWRKFAGAGRLLVTWPPLDPPRVGLVVVNW